MISFKDIELQDKELITSYTQNSPRRNCDLILQPMQLAFSIQYKVCHHGRLPPADNCHPHCLPEGDTYQL